MTSTTRSELLDKISAILEHFWEEKAITELEMAGVLFTKAVEVALSTMVETSDEEDEGEDEDE